MILAGASGSCFGKGDDHLGGLMIIWVGKFKTSLARQACVRGLRDDHLGRLMIIWVGEGHSNARKSPTVPQTQVIISFLSPFILSILLIPSKFSCPT